jgi:hypothetical protein
MALPMKIKNSGKGADNQLKGSWAINFTMTNPSWSFSLAIMTRLTITEYMCHKWPQICSTCRKHFPVVSSLMCITLLYRANILSWYNLFLIVHLWQFKIEGQTTQWAKNNGQTAIDKRINRKLKIEWHKFK